MVGGVIYATTKRIIKVDYVYIYSAIFFPILKFEGF